MRGVCADSDRACTRRMNTEHYRNSSARLRLFVALQINGRVTTIAHVDLRYIKEQLERFVHRERPNQLASTQNDICNPLLDCLCTGQGLAAIRSPFCRYGD